MKFDIKAVIPSGNFQNHIPKTEIQKTIINDNKDKILLFLESFVNREDNITEDNIGEVKLKNSLVFTTWRNWLEANNIKNDYNSVAFGTRLGILIKKRNMTEFIRKDTNSNTIIHIQNLKKYFDENP
jgi:hypothetical protein